VKRKSIFVLLHNVEIFEAIFQKMNFTEVERKPFEDENKQLGLLMTFEGRGCGYSEDYYVAVPLPNPGTEDAKMFYSIRFPNGYYESKGDLSVFKKRHLEHRLALGHITVQSLSQ
jgi:hypothetical protein